MDSAYSTDTSHITLARYFSEWTPEQLSRLLLQQKLQICIAMDVYHMNSSHFSTISTTFSIITTWRFMADFLPFEPCVCVCVKHPTHGMDRMIFTHNADADYV